MKVYELEFKDEMAGVFRVSVVKDPAVEATLLHFNKEDVKSLYFTNDEKRVVYSVAMRPNKLIPRSNINGEPANIYYTTETVERLQQNYFKNNYNVSTNINHEQQDAEGIYMFESWIVKNPEKDKATELGLEVMQGDWVMAHKVDNDEIWNDVKQGNLDGLSVEIYAGYKEDSNFNKLEMTKEEKTPENLWGILKAFFNSDVPKEKTPEEIAAEEEVKKKAEEEKMAEEVPNAEAPVEDAGMSLEDAKALIESLEKENSDLKEQLAKAEADKVKSETDLQSMTAEFQKFKEEKPATTSIKNVPNEVKKSYEEMTPLEKFRFSKTQ